VAVYKADAIVIRSREYGESDKLITLFSREKGKLEAVAKGVRKPKSKQRGGTQLFTYADFLLYKGRNLDIVNQVNPKESFIHLWDDFDRMIAASGVAELLDAATLREQAEPQLFTLTLGSLFLMKIVDPYIVQATFALKILKFIGLLPGLDRCVSCGKQLKGEQIFLCVDDGVMCQTCKKDKYGMMVSPGSAAFMQQLLSVNIDRLDRLRWSKKMKEEIHQSLMFYSENKLEKRLLAWRTGNEM